MADVITLSSEDEEESPQRKKPRLITTETTTIVLSDEDEAKEDSPPLIVETTSQAEEIKPETNGEVSKVESIIAEPSLASKEPEAAGTSTSEEKEVDPIYLKLTAFTDKCLQSITIPKIKTRLFNTIPKITGQYEKLKRFNSKASDLECMLDSDKNVKYDSYKAVVRFTEIFDFLKDKLKSEENKVLLSGPKKQLLNKLEKTLLLVRKRIRKLDEAEVDFDEEENSNYIKAARYKEKAQQIFKKICELRKEDPNSGRLAYNKLNFTQSKYPKINNVLNKKYKNTIEFPTYFEMDKCIRNCVDIDELGITEEMLKAEIKFCFEQLGTIMKQRRKLDLYDTHTDFIQENDDPASHDPEMEQTLRENYEKGNAKMAEIYEKYTRMQESGVNPDVSTDSEDSNIADSE
ncbi:hypothetical protein RN001_014903 [Aquatica leii]|uniref:Daxx histone-binding domain-containing protein n=1 Tax=Aquatica leii TaxID=1421715 RepID=A0AAN7NYK3_9COLE|nr:hypothetical protein RN001_014903 [Aquatica leii]